MVGDRPMLQCVAARQIPMPIDLPIPPLEFRNIVGLPDVAQFDDPTLSPSWPARLDPPAYVLDFGCGAGRIARHLIRRDPRPIRYLGLDRHQGLIAWCREHLLPRAPGFDFEHHDVYHPALNPGGVPGHLALPNADAEVTLFFAISVFTHLLEEDAAFYLRELGRVLHPDGVAVTTWFLFDKGDFPMMQEFQNALMINPCDLTNAVIFDRKWLLETAAAAGLVPTVVHAPAVRGFHWTIQFERSGSGRVQAEFPADVAPRGVRRPPLR